MTHFNAHIIPFVSILLYLIAAFLQYFSIVSLVFSNAAGIARLMFLRTLIPVLSVLAILLHAFWLHQKIDLPSGQDINFFNMLSFVMWFMAVVLILTIFRQAFQNLRIFVFPVAALSIGITIFFPLSPVLKPMTGHPEEWLHVWLAALTLGFVFIAMLQAVLLFVQDRWLHHYQNLPALIKKMPPIESMERLLFETILIVFFLLSIIFGSSFYFFQHIFQSPLLQKTLLVLVAWVLLFVLLIGRYFFGWRGKKAIIYTLLTFLTLALIYFLPIYQ